MKFFGHKNGSKIIYELCRLDSLKNDKSYSKKYIFAVESLFDFSNIKFDLKYLTLDFLSNNIKLLKFNGLFLITINYENGWCSNQGNIIALYLIDDKNKLIDNDTITGCHYHNGNIEIEDWDNDNSDDIIFTINTPVQSVSIIGSFLRVYSLNKQTSKLYEKFELETQLRDCAWNRENVCELIERLYLFNNDRTMIEIKEKKYTFDRDDFEWEKPIKNKNCVKDSSYYYYIDSNSLKYLQKNKEF